MIINNGKKAILVGLILILAALLGWLFMNQQKEPIKIGAIIALSGPAGHHVNVRDGMQLAIDEINEFGGINGRKLELIVEDSRTDPEEGQKAFNRLEARHHPDLYVSTLSSVSMKLAPLAEKHQVPLAGLIVSTPRFPGNRHWAYRFSIASKDESEVILKLLKDLNVKRLGVLYQNEEFGLSVFKILQRGFEQSGGFIRGVPFKPRQPVFENKIESLKDMEAIYVVGFVRNEGSAIKMLKQLNYKGIILAASPATTYSVRTIPEADGVYVASTILYNPGHYYAAQASQKFTGKYKKKFTHHAATGYDFTRLLGGLLEDVEISRSEIRRRLEAGFVYHGVFGTLNVPAGENDILYPLFPAKIVDGRIKYF